MTTLKPYPSNLKKTLDSIFNCLQQIVRLRPQDSQAFTNISNTFVMGRKVAKVPASSTDVTGSYIGDVNFTDAFLYFCVDNGSGGAEWVRVSASTF